MKDILQVAQGIAGHGTEYYGVISGSVEVVHISTAVMYTSLPCKVIHTQRLKNVDIPKSYMKSSNVSDKDTWNALHCFWEFFYVISSGLGKLQPLALSLSLYYHCRSNYHVTQQRFVLI